MQELAAKAGNARNREKTVDLDPVDYAVISQALIAIAREMGIAKPEDRALSGSELNKMDDARLDAEVKSVAVFARVTAAV